MSAVEGRGGLFIVVLAEREGGDRGGRRRHNQCRRCAEKAERLLAEEARFAVCAESCEDEPDDHSPIENQEKTRRRRQRRPAAPNPNPGRKNPKTLSTEEEEG